MTLLLACSSNIIEIHGYFHHLKDVPMKNGIENFDQIMHCWLTSHFKSPLFVSYQPCQTLSGIFLLPTEKYTFQHNLILLLYYNTAFT